MFIPDPSSGPWGAPSGPKVDERRPGEHDGDLADRYEALRAAALSGGPGRAGLGAGLLAARGMAAWMRGWQACTPPPPEPCTRSSSRLPDTGAGAEVVAVLAAMALACAGDNGKR